VHLQRPPPPASALPPPRRHHQAPPDTYRYPPDRSHDAAFVVPKYNTSFFSEYIMLEQIGKGAYGRVAKARRRADGRLVVVKEIRHAGLSQV
jgi:serine/threonine protein kinase